MKKNLSIILLILTLTANAQDYSKMSSFVRQMVTRHHADHTSAKGTGISNKQDASASQVTLTLIQGEEDALRGKCLCHQGDIHIVASTIEQLVEMSYSDHISHIEASECNNDITLDDAALHTSVGTLWQGGENLPQAFRGAGTVIGIADIGFDLTHPAFRDDNGNLRINRFWDFLNIPENKEYDATDNYPIGTFFDNPEAILEQGHSADAELTFHGTHTLGIAAGNNCGTTFQGMAPEADIYVVNDIVSTNIALLPERLYSHYNSTFILLAFQKIYDYADEQHKPCVISYSIAGPQSINDGDLLMKQYLARMTGPGHIFVASVGNEGAKSGYMPKSSTQTTVGGVIKTEKEVVYLGVSTPKSLTMYITNYNLPTPVTEKVILDMPATANETGFTSASGLIYGEHNRVTFSDLDYLTLSIFPFQDPFREGRASYDIIVRSGYSDLNSYTLQFTAEDTEADIFIQNGSLVKSDFDTSLTGAIANSGNLQRPGSLEEVIGVGASAWRTNYINTSGETITDNNGSNGERAAFSGCGPAVSGLTKPDILAPGANISSATNSFCHDIKKNRITQQITYEEKEYTWYNISGTSMATPVVAGIIALWLEADPTLTKERILDVFAHTATHYDESLTYPNNHYGYGEIDAYKGLLYILNLTGIKELSAHHLSNATVRPKNDGTVSIRLDDEPQQSLRCKAFTTDGKLVCTTLLPAHSTEHTISLPNIHGIVAIQIDGMGSTLVRLP